MAQDKLNVAVIGCGNVAGAYGEQMQAYDNVTVHGAFDLDASRAEEYTKKYGGKVYETLDAALADDAVDIILNLTIHHAHYEVITQCLNAGKHVHTEKPIALTYAEAKELVELAKAKDLRLSSAPITYMGECAQTAWKQIRDGKCGTVRVVYAEVNHGRIESWHPNPGPFYDVGVMFDVGVYPLTILTAFFGPVKRVTAAGKVVYPHRKTKEGKEFTVNAPDFMVAIIELEDGPWVRLTANFYIENSKQGGNIEFHGDEGSVIMGNFQAFQAGVEYAEFGASGWENVPPIREAKVKGVEFARGIEELADAIQEGRPQRATGDQAAHVVEIIEGMNRSMKEGTPVEITSTFPRPTPMPWGA